ncbi:MAG: (Fe-S)-binding protein [Candidatus Abyssubacteria bacterium]
MFHKERCDLCGDCLVECKYTDYDREGAIAEITALMEGRPTNIAKQCITCAACNEVCPQDANPFDLICEVQEKTNALEVPDAVIQMFDSMCKGRNEVRQGAPGKPAISMCIVGPAFPRPLEGSLFDDLTHIRGEDYFCYIGWIHVGKWSPLQNGIKSFIDNLAKTGAKEIVFAHDDCYATVTSQAKQFGIPVPFRPIHIIEYLRDQMKARRGEIKKLGMKIAYQRPCASRYTPEKEPMVDEVFELIGVERVARKYDRKDALCCGLPLMFRDMARGQEIQAKNLDDAKSAGATAMTFLCPVCVRGLGGGAVERGMGIYMLSDLCRLALGEEIPAFSG